MRNTCPGEGPDDLDKALLLQFLLILLDWSLNHGGLS
jgi:hypothetical protein